MRKKMECKSCGSERWFEDQKVEFCPDCGSTDLKFEIFPEYVPEVRPQTNSVKSSKLDSNEFSEPFKEPVDPLGLSSPYQSPQTQSRSRSGIATGMSDGTKIRIVIGIIGFIMFFSAVGILLGGSFSFGSIGGIAGVITLMVIGFIFLAIATKGEICCQGC